MSSSKHPRFALPGPYRLFFWLLLVAGMGCLVAAPLSFRVLSDNIRAAIFFPDAATGFADLWQFNFRQGNTLLAAQAAALAGIGVFCLLTAACLAQRAAWAPACCRALCLGVFAPGAIFLALYPYYTEPEQNLSMPATAAVLLAACLTGYRYFELNPLQGIKAAPPERAAAAERVPPGVALLQGLCLLLFVNNAYFLLRGLNMPWDTGILAEYPVLWLSYLPGCLFPLWIFVILTWERDYPALCIALACWITAEIFLPTAAWYLFGSQANPVGSAVFSSGLICLYLGLLWWRIDYERAGAAWFSAHENRRDNGKGRPGLLWALRSAPCRKIAGQALEAVRQGRPPVLVLAFLLFSAFTLLNFRGHLVTMQQFIPPGASSPSLLWPVCLAYVCYGLVFLLWIACVFGALKVHRTTPAACRLLSVLLAVLPLPVLAAMLASQSFSWSLIALIPLGVLFQDEGLFLVYMAAFFYFSRSRTIAEAFSPDRIKPESLFDTVPLPLIALILFCLMRFLHYGVGGFTQLASLFMQDAPLFYGYAAILASLPLALTWTFCPLYFLVLLRMKDKTVHDLVRFLGIWIACAVLSGFAASWSSLLSGSMADFFIAAWNFLRAPLPLLLAAGWYLNESTQLRAWLAARRTAISVFQL